MRTFLIETCFLFLAFTLTASADVPATMSYQGIITDSSGTPVDDADYDGILSIYDAASGGNLKWTSGTITITTISGLFSYELGSGTPLPADIFADNPDLWLGIKIDTNPELSPRSKLTSHAWSFHSASTDSLISGPGVVQQISDQMNPVTMINGFFVQIGEDTLFAPDSGYALIQATANVQCQNLPNSFAGLTLGLQDSTGTNLSDQNFAWILPTGSPTGGHANTLHIHRIFEVRPGRNIFSLAGVDFLDAGHTFEISNYVMTMTYFPYTYGTLQLTPAPAVSGDKPKTIRLSENELQHLRNLSGISSGSN